tara:strand:- start:337 stop:462 length:126 start_codon:yes stop_codon:yes gene_type:complete
MKKRIKNEDDIMLIIFGICIGVPLGMFILAGLRALEISGIL